MAEDIVLQRFVQNGVAMVRAPDGRVFTQADVQRYNNPGMDFDDATGEPLAMVPTIEDRPAAEARSLGSQVGNEDLAAGRALALDPSTSLYSLLDPEGRYANTPLGYVNQAIMRAPDLVLGGLLAGGGALQKAAGYGSDALGLGLSPGDIPNTEEMGQLADALYALPASRMLGSISEAGGRAAAARGVVERLNQPGPVPTMYSNPLALSGQAVGPAEERGQQIIDMLTSGRVADITEDMLDLGDPVLNTRLNQYLFENYDLPMDDASRMARAREMAPQDEFHGTTTGTEMIAPNAFLGSGSRQGIGFVTSDNPYVASSYADPSFGAVLPMRTPSLPPEVPRIDVGGKLWSDISVDTPVSLGDRVVTARQLSAEPADVGGVLSTNQLSRGASFDYPGIVFSNILDRSIHAPRPNTDDGMDILREFQRLASEPSTVTMRQDTRGMRSRFARFDPRLAHLRNLSAGVGGLGLLTIPQEEQ